MSDSALVDLVITRLAATTEHHRARTRLALNVLGNPSAGFMLTGRMRDFASLPEIAQDAMLRRCEMSVVPQLRQLFDGLKRLIVNTWYSRPQAWAEIGCAGPLHQRSPQVPWEGPLADAGPVVSAAPRDREAPRPLPAGVIDASQLVADQTITTQYCIIGSGAGGSVAACTLSEAGCDVVILEAGPYRDAGSFSAHEGDGVRDLYADAALRTTEDLGFSLLQGRCAGGGTTINWMVMLRTPDYVLDEWTRTHGTVDMSPHGMRAVFDRFEAENGVGQVADAAHSRANRILLDGARALGWQAHPANINARECLRAGLCGLGCPYDAKYGMLKTHLARALNAGARLFCGVQAERISTAQQRRTVVARTADGRRVVIHADRVIVAGGAVETAALLQRSGIGNAHVGRHLRLHPTTAVVGVYDEPVYAGTGIPLSTYCDEFSPMNDGYGHWIETPPLSPGLASIALAGFGSSHRVQMREYPFLAPFIVLARDGSPKDPSVGAVNWQRSGHARIDYRVSAADRAVLIHGMESAARIHFAMGARSVFTLHRDGARMQSEAEIANIRRRTQQFGDPALFSAHVNGTCRISANAQQGVCAGDGSVRGADGIYVMDGSLLPTAPGVNPHETIAAVVSVLAGRLVGVGH